MRRLLAILLVVPALAGDEPSPRAALRIPDDLWERVRAETGGRTIGYTGDEMRFYGGREHLLRTVENLFRDARAIPRETGRITDDLLALAAAGKIDEVLQRCWSLVDMPAGRNFPAVPKDSWGVAWIPAKATPAEAFAALADVPEWKGPPRPTEEERARFGELPLAVQRVAVRIAVGAIEAERWFTDGDHGFLPKEFELVFRQVYELQIRPWTDEEYGQSATRAHEAIDLLRKDDRSRLAYASVILGAHLRTAVEEWKGHEGDAAPEGRWKFTTPLGWLVIAGSADDELDAATLEPNTWCVLDLGGSDRWKGAFATPHRGSSSAVGIAVDLAGDDVWDAGEEAAALGCGSLGIGALLDLGGNDRYVVKESGLGCGWFGTGLLWDAAGNDTYVVKTRWGQGAAHAGVGALIDIAGDDRYECAEQSQGMGSTLGCGLLLDLAGNDAYVCRDDGNVSELYLNQSVAMAQGCGYGRRADLGDGRSLAGGWGLLVDGQGNDRYHAQCWAQGCGYWWGVGVLEDRGGDDVYENGKYSLGAAAHFAIGVQVDLAGNDRYNQGVTTTKNQFQGHARDGSIGISIDGDGNDRYLLKNLCAGCADLGSIAIFWDRRGDDVYEATMEEGLGDAAPFGSTTAYPPSNSWRDDLWAIGIFLDTDGTDVYRGDPRGEKGSRDAASWNERRGPFSRGFGADVPLDR
ncbi:MAG: hypothetical protein ACHQ1G_01170 [Planctomycetota bacterium]